MSAVSSAEPLQLYTFSWRATGLGHELLSEASRLNGALSRFETVCREYTVHVGYLPGAISSHARASIALADWVRDVGTDFLRADADGFWAWVERTRLQQKYERAVVWYLELLDRIRNAMSLIGIGALTFAFHNGSRAGWVTVRVPGWAKMRPFLGNIKELGGLKTSLTTIPVRSLPGYLGRVMKKAAILDVLLRWGRDFVELHENTSKMFSAWAVDAAIVAGSTVVAVKLGAVAIAALATAPAWLVAGAIVVVTGVAFIAITFVLDKTVRERSIATLDDKVFDPVGKKITQGMNAVGAAVDGAARRFKQTSTWKFFFGKDEISQQVQGNFWRNAAAFSRRYDTRIRLFAAPVSMAPAVGDLWSANILMATGKMEKDEFIIRQKYNAAGAVASLATGLVGDSFIGAAANARQEVELVHEGLMSTDEFLISQAFNVGGFGLGIVGPKVAEDLLPMKYAVPNLFSAKWFIGKSANYSRLREVLGTSPETVVVYVDAMRASDIVQSWLREWPGFHEDGILDSASANPTPGPAPVPTPTPVPAATPAAQAPASESPVAPIRATPFVSQWNGTNGGNNCGPASVAMALQSLGHDMSLDAAAGQMRPAGVTGTTTDFKDPSLVKWLKDDLHVETADVTSLDDLKHELDAGHPVILRVMPSHYVRTEGERSIPYPDTSGFVNEPHIVVVTRYNAELKTIYINDPLAVKPDPEHPGSLVADPDTGTDFEVPVEEFEKAASTWYGSALKPMQRL